MASELIIDDDYILNTAEHLAQQGETLDTMYFEYLSIMKNICENATMNGRVAQALLNFTETAQMMQDKFSVIAQNASTDTTDFKSEIDEKDEYLY